MYCHQCGVKLAANTNFCSGCGARQHTTQPAEPPRHTHLVGFSKKINDPFFAKYVKNSNRWAAIFGGGLALIAVVGFTLAGTMGVDNMENPQAMFQGMGVGGMFLLITLFTIISKKQSGTWDGTVVDKKITKKKKKQSESDDYSRYVDYLEYQVLIRADDGKTHRLVRGDDTLYNYYRVGDRVRHHAGLTGYEKYDKSTDSIIFCVACSSLNKMEDDYCFQCRGPLLK